VFEDAGSRGVELSPRGVAIVLARDEGGSGIGEVRLIEQPAMLEHFSAVLQSNPYGIGGSEGRLGLTMQDIKGLGAPLRELVTPAPTDRATILRRIHEAARDFWLTRLWARSCADFGSAGFELACANEKQKEFCDQLAEHLNWDRIDYMLHYHMALTESVYVWWRYYPSLQNRSALAPDGQYVPVWIETLPPSVIGFTTTGRVGIYADRLQPLASIAHKPTNQRSQEEIVYLQQFPSDLIAAAAGRRRGNLLYPLDELDTRQFGHTRVEHWSKADWEHWPVPMLYTVLADLEYLLMCQDVDYAGAFQMKAGLMIWSVGPTEPKPDAPGPKRPQLKALETMVRNALAERHTHIFAGNDFNVRWVVPPIELFSREKYASALQRVMDVLGIPAVFYPVGHGAGGRSGIPYASGYISVKPWAQRILSNRRMIRRPTERVFWTLCYLNRIGGASPDHVEVHYDPNVLVDDRIRLSQVQFETQQGIISNRTALESLGRNYEAELQQKRDEIELAKKEPALFTPHYIPTKGIAGTQLPGQGGPTNPGAGRPQTQEVVAPDDAQPRPSTSAIEQAHIEDDIVSDDDDPLGALAFVEWDPETLDGFVADADPVVESFADDEFAANIEVSNMYIRIPVNTGSYKKHRYGPLNSKGIRLLYGIKADGTSEVATVLFRTDRWDMKRARSWIKKHSF